MDLMRRSSVVGRIDAFKRLFLVGVIAVSDYFVQKHARLAYN